MFVVILLLHLIHIFFDNKLCLEKKYNLIMSIDIEK
jgi:hypothetical protein